jgi:hypothetical protein
MVSVKAYKSLTSFEKTQTKTLLNLSNEIIEDLESESHIIVYEKSENSEISSLLIMNTSLFGYNFIKYLYLQKDQLNVVNMMKMIVKLPIVVEMKILTEEYCLILQENGFKQYSNYHEISEVLGFDTKIEHEVMIYFKKKYKTGKEKK